MSPTADRHDVMRRTLEYVISHPAEWDQEVWGHRTSAYASSCGTAFCLAGHAAVTIRRAAPVWSGTVLVAVVPRESPGVEVDVDDYAAVALGLDGRQADQLFDGGNSLRRLAELCYLYSRGAVDLLDRLPAPTDRDAVREAGDAAELYYRYATAVDDEGDARAILEDEFPNRYRVGASA